LEITRGEDIMGQILVALPSYTEMQDAILRLSVAYPRDWESMIDEPAIRQAAEAAFEFHFIRRPRMQVRIRLSADDPIANLPPQDLLARYWGAVPPADGDPTELNQLAADIFQAVEIGRIPGEGEMSA
jgi:exonuclease SbcD